MKNDNLSEKTNKKGSYENDYLSEKNKKKKDFERVFWLIVVIMIIYVIILVKLARPIK